MRDAPALPFGDGLVARARPGTLTPVLWFHGYAMDSRVWQEVWDDLPGWHHIGLDLPGHGGSRGIRPGEDLASIARVVARLAAAQGVRHLVGLSFGTMLALEVAMQMPDDYDTLVLGAPALARGPHDADVERRYEQLAGLYAESGAGPHMAQAWMRDPPALFRGAQRRPVLWLRLFWLASLHRWVELTDASMLALTSPPQDPARLRLVRASTLVVVGDEDLAAYRLSADLVSGAVPGCHRWEMAQAGHLCLLERPSEAAAAIDAHLRGR